MRSLAEVLLRQPGQGFEVAADQRFSLAPRPSLDALLEPVGLADVLALACVDEADRQPMARVVRAHAVLVLPHSSVQVPGAADVVGVVGAPQDVHPCHVSKDIGDVTSRRARRPQTWFRYAPLAGA